jgi:hypothetical protein
LSEQLFIWRDKSLDTIGDLMDAMGAIDSDDVAREFMQAYRAVSPHADENIGYLTGYYGATEAQEMRRRFDVSHPIFGRESPTQEQALEAGKRWALGEFE